ncbi:MAG: DivIVA domain-containing protein, partial [Microbacterium sp.]
MTTIDDDPDALVAESAPSDEVETHPRFATVTRGRGYDPGAVDDFLGRARASFEDEDAEGELTAQGIREASFPLVRHGYAVASVDAALGRIEDAFA